MFVSGEGGGGWLGKPQKCPPPLNQKGSSDRKIGLPIWRKNSKRAAYIDEKAPHKEKKVTEKAFKQRKKLSIMKKKYQKGPDIIKNNFPIFRSGGGRAPTHASPWGTHVWN